MNNFTKENVIATLTNPEMLEEIAKQLQMLILLVYFDQCQKRENADSSDEETAESSSEVEPPDAFICPLCQTATMYSADALLPGQGLDRMCISLTCIKQSILTMARTYALEVPSTGQ